MVKIGKPVNREPFQEARKAIVVSVFGARLFKFS